jgi:hypothetical protein
MIYYYYYCFLFVARGVRADMLQGVPMGLVMGSIPFLLQSKLTYTELGIFSIAGYPYALKLFWSPVVDACYSKHILSSLSAACHACAVLSCRVLCVCVCGDVCVWWCYTLTLKYG